MELDIKSEVSSESNARRLGHMVAEGNQEEEDLSEEGLAAKEFKRYLSNLLSGVLGHSDEGSEVAIINDIEVAAKDKKLYERSLRCSAVPLLPPPVVLYSEMSSQPVALASKNNGRSVSRTNGRSKVVSKHVQADCSLSDITFFPPLEDSNNEGVEDMRKDTALDAVVTGLKPFSFFSTGFNIEFPDFSVKSDRVEVESKSAQISDDRPSNKDTPISFGFPRNWFTY